MKNQKLGLFSCIGILVGGCIGSAIFSLSGLTMINAGNASILSWIIAAFILASYGLFVAELAVRHPESGGVYVFPAKALNRACGFYSAWGYIISNITAVAFSAITVGTFVCAGLSAVTQGAIWAHQQQITLIAAVATIVLVTILNLLDIHSVGRINTVLVFLLAVSMIIYIVFAVSSPAFDVNLYSDFFTGAQGSVGWIRVIPNAMVAYGTCVAIAFMVGRVENPDVTVPKSLRIAITLVVILYVGMIASTLGIVNWKTLAEENGTYQPMFIAINHMGYSTAITIFLNILIGVAGLLALFTTVLVVQHLNALAIRSTAGDGLLPAFLSKENKYGMPYVATLINAGIALVLCFFSDFTNLIVNLGSLTSAVTMMIVMASFLVERRKFGKKELIFHAPGGCVFAIIIMIIILLTYVPSIINLDTGTFAADAGSMWIFTGIIYAVGTVIYLIFRKRSK